MYQALDGPSKQFSLSVDDATVKEITNNAPLDERKVVTMQVKSGGKLFVYFGDGSNTPSISDMQNDGIDHPNKVIRSYEASQSQPIFVLAENGATVDVKIIERA